MHAPLLAAVLVLVAASATAQPLPVDALFCNIQCESADPQATCRIGLIDDLVIQGKRLDIFALATDDGVELGGELSLPTGDGGRIVLAEAALVLRFSQPGENACQSGFDTVRGVARLPVPGVGHLPEGVVEVIEQPMASIGLDLGRNLLPEDSPWCLPGLGLDCDCAEFCLDEVPILRTDSHYFSFDIDSRYVLAIGGIELPSSPGVSATFVLDTTDPYFYLTGSATGIPGLPTPLSAIGGGFGFSWHDEIPFVPLSTYPFGDAMLPFRGGYAAQLKLPIFVTEFERIKVLLDGMLIGSLDPDADGDHPFRTPAAFLDDPDLALGANGLLSVRFSPFKKPDPKKAPKKSKPTTSKDVQKEGQKSQKSGLPNALLALEFEVGAASAVSRVHPTFAELYLSGRLGDEQSLLPDFMPLPVGAGAGTRMAAYFSTKPGESFVQAEGSLGLDTTNLARWAKMEEIGVVLGVDGFLRADEDGFRIAGSTGSQMNPSVTPSGTAGVEAFIAKNGIDTHVTLRGAMTVAGEGFPDAALTLSPRGMEIEGTLRLDAHDFDMRGSFRGTKGHLEGARQIDFPYEREDTIRKLQLLDQILNQSVEVQLAEAHLAQAALVLERHRQDAEAVAADLAVAIAQVAALQAQVDALSVQIAQKESDLADQLARNCNADFTGCGSCSSCASRCDCGFGDVFCAADCVACQTARTACLAARETCRVANIAICNADRTLKLAALAVEIGALETARAGVIVAKDVALAVLGTIQAANNLALAVLATAEATAEAAQAGLDAAQAGLAALQDQLENLPPIRGTLRADVSLVIETGPKGTKKTGKVVGSFEGKKVAKGRIDLDTSPSKACATVPLKTLGEICTTL